MAGRRAHGLRPEASVQGSTVFAFLAWQGTFVLALLIMAAYAPLRLAFGYVVRERPATFELIGLFAAYTAAQGALPALLTRLFPGQR